MKYILALLFVMLLVGSCILPIIHKVETNPSVFDNVTLMPYIMVIGTEKVPNHSYPGFWDRDILGMGYINAETLEIIIPAQYEWTGNFVGNFAVVVLRKNYKERIINKENKVVLSGFDEAILYQSEDRSTVFALTGNYEGWWSSTSGDMFPIRVSRPSRTHFRLYNLTTGKQVLRKYIWGYDWPKIMFFGNYMTYDKEVYELKANGDLEKSEIDFDGFITNVATQINLDYDYKKMGGIFWHRELLDFLWSNNTLDKHLTDVSLMLKEVPDNLRIRHGLLSTVWEYGDDWAEKIDFAEYYPLNRDEIHPLARKDWLYEIEFVNRHGKTYLGLYNPSKNIWVIPPVELGWADNFYQTIYDDWIGIKSKFLVPFFNIRTRKKYTYLYSQSYGGPMYYRGHLLQEKGDIGKVIIEDF